MSGVNNNSVLGSALANTQRSNSANSQSGGSGLAIDDFYKMLAAQLKYQDADNPMDTSEMMAQMVQTEMVEALADMSQSVQQMSSINVTTYTSSMVGKEATMAVLDKDGKFTGEVETGVITGVILGTDPVLFIGDKKYSLSQLMSLGKVPEEELKPKPPTDENDKDDSKKPTPYNR